jgi:hypothetical protein
MNLESDKSNKKYLNSPVNNYYKIEESPTLKEVKSLNDSIYKHHGEFQESPPLSVNMGAMKISGEQSNIKFYVSRNINQMQSPSMNHIQSPSMNHMQSPSMNHMNYNHFNKMQSPSMNYMNNTNHMNYNQMQSPSMNYMNNTNHMNYNQMQSPSMNYMNNPNHMNYYMMNNPNYMFNPINNQITENDDIKSALKLLIEDLSERKRKEKEDEEKKEQKKKLEESNRINLDNNLNIPGIKKKSKTIDFSNLNDEEIFKVKEKFKLLFTDLRNKYEKWGITEPDYEKTPLHLIHKSYEDIVKTICIYQNAMRWKIYIILFICGLEYYFYYVKGWESFKNLTKNQLKSIDKYNKFLIEYSAMFYVDSDNEDEEQEEINPLYQIIINILSSLACFTSINFMSKGLAPEFIFNEADKFVSPPTGNAKLHSTGISDVPEPLSGFSNPSTFMNILPSLFSMFGGSSNQEQNQNTQPVNAVPVNEKPKDDFDDVEF